jgi:hypothetical protein
MKALELTVYPIWDAGDGDLYADRDDHQHPTRVDFEVYRKRLTEPELAAEFWQACDERTRDAGNILSGQHENPYAQKAFQTSIDRAKTLHRFATRPHYDEATPEPEGTP